jgi:hypothetical protein
MCPCIGAPPILKLLFKHSGKLEGLWKFVLKKPSYTFVFAINESWKERIFLYELEVI